MVVTFTKSLSNKEQAQWIEFCKRFPSVSVMQYPGWFEVYQPSKTVRYVSLMIGENICAICTVIEHFPLAEIYWGPISTSEEYSSRVIAEIKQFYKKRYFAQVKIIPSEIDNTVTNNTFRWSTLMIDVTNNNWKEAYKTNHKRNIKKGFHDGLYVKNIESIIDIKTFADIYLRMHRKRQIKAIIKNPDNDFVTIHSFLEAKQLGYMLGVYDTNNCLLGGITLSSEGNKMFYLFGASDPDKRDVPILHLAFDKAFEIAYSQGKELFDLGGFDEHASETDQVYSINRFKMGFGGYIVRNKPTMVMKCAFLINILYTITKKIKQRL